MRRAPPSDNSSSLLFFAVLLGAKNKGGQLFCKEDLEWEIKCHAQIFRDLRVLEMKQEVVPTDRQNETSLPTEAAGSYPPTGQIIHINTTVTEHSQNQEATLEDKRSHTQTTFVPFLLGQDSAWKIWPARESLSSCFHL